MTFSIDNPRGVATTPPLGKCVWEKPSGEQGLISGLLIPRLLPVRRLSSFEMFLKLEANIGGHVNFLDDLWIGNMTSPFRRKSASKNDFVGLHHASFLDTMFK